MSKKRKNKGDGSVYRIADGKWRAKVIYKGYVKSRRADTKAEAQDLIKELKKELIGEEKARKEGRRNRELTRLSSTTKVFENFLEFKKIGKKKIKPTSYQRLESIVHTHILPKLGKTQFTQITSRDINLLLDDLAKNGKGYSTVKKVHDAFSACYSYAINEEHIVELQENPMPSVYLNTNDFTSNNDVEFYTEAERKLIEKVALKKNSLGKPVHRYGAAYILLANTGMRAGELCGLKRENIDLENRILKIEGTAITYKKVDEKGNKGWVTVYQDTPKTSSSNRIIPLNDKAVILIKDIMENLPNGEFLIYTANGTMVPPSKLTKYFYEILDEAGVERKKCPLHAFRDTFATELFNNDVDVPTVGSLLGHAPGSGVTERHYINILNERKARAVNIISI